MKIVVVGGAGAMGGVWASSLAQAGHELHILDVAKDAIDTINRDGLTVEEPDGRRLNVRIPATSDSATVGICDLAIIFTKSQHTAAAGNLVRDAVGPETTVLTLQNGWGNAQTLAEIYRPDQIAMGITYHGARVLAPGTIAHTSAPGVTSIGPFVDQALTGTIEEIAAVMSAAGIETQVGVDIKSEVWKKLVLNASALPVSGLTGLPSKAMSERPDVVALCFAVAREVVEVGLAMGFSLDLNERLENISAILAAGGTGKASMLQDVEARRPTEIEAINGAVVRQGELVGIPTPLNAALATLILGREASWLAS